MRERERREREKWSESRGEVNGGGASILGAFIMTEMTKLPLLFQNPTVVTWLASSVSLLNSIFNT